jgi:hypothetical protein
MRIRAAKESDLAVMQDIERAAGSSFREIGMPEIAEDEPLPRHHEQYTPALLPGEVVFEVFDMDLYCTGGIIVSFCFRRPSRTARRWR